MKKLDEAHHSYDDPDYNTDFRPLKTEDTVRVFHGYRDLADAVSAARYGLSGKKRANRVYSYEADNNPYGLFVTLSRKVATEFAGRDQIIMEFNAPASELEAPVWPGGSYTVQGQMSKYWGHGAKGKAARKQAQKDAENNTNSQLDHIAQSDKKHLAQMMMGGGEYQALFVGHLDPNDIVAFHVRPSGDEYHYRNPWTAISREEFLEKYGHAQLKQEDYARNRMFRPTETFNGDEFLKRLSTRFKKPQDVEEIDDGLRWMWHGILDSKNKTAAFADAMDMYIWPKQYVDAMKWMKSRYGSAAKKVSENYDWKGVVGTKMWFHPATGEIISVDFQDNHVDVLREYPEKFGLGDDLEDPEMMIETAISCGWVKIINFDEPKTIAEAGSHKGYVNALNVYLARRGLSLLEKRNQLPDQIEVDIGPNGAHFLLEFEQIDDFIHSGKIPLG